jgi:hypothetical protein
MDISLLSIMLNILAPTNNISFITISSNCSYDWHVNLFNEFNDKFGKIKIIEDVCSMLNVLLKHQH